MSFLGGLLGSDKPDEKFLDDQAVQEDHRDNLYVGPFIDTACTVYDSMFDTLRFIIRGRANVIEKLDETVGKLEKQCQKIIDKYREILSKLNDVGAGLSVDLSLNIAREAFDLLNSNPILRRYVGEANYWALWDTLAVLAGNGSDIGGDIGSNIKDALKGAIYALLSMTNGLMHFESYLTQITQFWGYLYAKEIPLRLTDSICPQVTCQYYYRKVMPGNPVPGPGNYVPLPFPRFDYTKSLEDIAAFRYNDPATWFVLTPQSRAQFQKAQAYWKSNYTDAHSPSDLLASASNLVTSNSYTIGFGPRNSYPGGDAPLKVGATFHQLDTERMESFPVRLMADSLAEAFANVDSAYLAAVSRLAQPDIVATRDSRVAAEIIAAGGVAEDVDTYGGTWAYYLWVENDPMMHAAVDACVSVAEEVPEFIAYRNAVIALGETYRESFNSPYLNVYSDDSPLLQYLLTFYGKAAEEASLRQLTDLLNSHPSTWTESGAPYGIYSDEPASMDVYTSLAVGLAHPDTPFYSAANAILSAEIDADGEIGLKIDGGREPLFAAIGIYGDLKGLYPWKYEIVPLDAFNEDWARIKGSYHIYYKKADPSKVIFADRTIQKGTVKYIATCQAAVSDSIQRGSESFTAYIFPSETCSVVPVPPPGMYLGTEFASFSSTQRIDATSPTGDKAFMYDLTTNSIPRYPKYVDSEKWSIMDLIHELWLLADALAPICGDGGRRKAELNDLLNQFGLNVKNSSKNGPLFIGQLPADGEGEHVDLEFTLMADFAARLRKMIDAVYGVRDEVLAATQAW